MTKPTGRPTGRPAVAPEIRFWEKVQVVASGCWEWQGNIVHGYGHFWNHKTLKAHRWAYEFLVGPIPEGLTLDHLCRNRRCVRPDHLEPCTIKVNSLRGTSPFALNAQKTQCKRGHPLSGDNLSINEKGARVCLVCRRASGRISDARRRERVRSRAR